MPPKNLQPFYGRVKASNTSSCTYTLINIFNRHHVLVIDDVHLLRVKLSERGC